MADKSLWFSRHARNRMRRDHVTREGVEECLRKPQAVIPGDSGRQNYWSPYQTGYLRVTIAEEPDRIAIVSVVRKVKGPR